MTNHNNNTKRLIRNTTFLYIRMLVVTLVSLYTSRIVMQALGFEDFGIYNIVASIIVLFSFFKSALTNATTRFLSYDLGAENDLNLKRTFSMAINFHIILAIGIAILLELVGPWYIANHLQVSPNRIEAATYAFHLSILTFAIGIIQNPFDSCVIAHEKMDFYALISIIDVLLKLGIAYSLLASPFDHLVTYAFLLSISAGCICIVIMGWCYAKLKNCRYQFIWDSTLIRKFASYSGWSLLVNFTDTTVIQGRAILFNSYLNIIANAALGVANQVFNAVALFARNFANAFTPQLFKSYASNDTNYFHTLIYSTSKYSYFLLLCPLIPILANIDFILSVWLGNYPPLAPVYIKSMALFAIFDAYQAPLWNAIFATGDIKIHQIMMSIIKISIFPITLLCLYLGDDGHIALWMWGMGNVICAIARIIYARKAIQLNIHEYLHKAVLPILIVSAICIPIPYCIVNRIGENWTSLLLSTFTFIVFLFAVAFFLGMNKSERQYICSLVTRSKS